METPRSKRRFLELSFSPDGKAAMDTSGLRDIMSDILDEKLEKHLKPIKDELAEFKSKSERKQTENSQAISSLKKEVNDVKSENTLLKQQLLKLEGFQRKNNLRIVGLRENRGENIEIAVISMFNEILQRSQHFDEKTLERVHRLGAFSKHRRRDVLARFANFKDKLTVLEMKDRLKEKHGILLFDDLPLDIQRRHQKLHPVFKALRFVKENTQGNGPVTSVKLKDGSLVLNGRTYGVENLKELPPDVALDKLFTVTQDDTTAFFRCYSPLSNHYSCHFEVNGENYSSMEKFIMMQKAHLFGDDQSVEQMRMEDDPVALKRLGKTVKDFEPKKWNREIDNILATGLQAKFTQSDVLCDFLKNTGKTVLVEANPNDKKFAVGKSLFSKDIWDSSKWNGENKLGKALMKIREALSEVDQNSFNSLELS